VKNAGVKVGGKHVSKIGHGLFVLLGVGEDDSEKKAEILAEKLSKLRVMSLDSARDKAKEKRKMNYSVKDVDGEVLVVSQFTLLADTSAGNRPSFIKAGRPEFAEKLYLHFVKRLESLGIKVATGEFGSYMNIEAELDGPVTIII